MAVRRSPGQRLAKGPFTLLHLRLAAKGSPCAGANTVHLPSQQCLSGA